jgi:hypothetical protein
MLASNVSLGLLVKEQKPARLEQAMGSWYPHVPFMYFGWKNPLKPVSALLIIDLCVGLHRFSQFMLRCIYLSRKSPFPRP